MIDSTEFRANSGGIPGSGLRVFTLLALVELDAGGLGGDRPGGAALLWVPDTRFAGYLHRLSPVTAGHVLLRSESRPGEQASTLRKF